MRITATYTEPPNSYGQPIGAVVTTQSATSAPFTFDSWVLATTLAGQQAAALARFDDATKDMRARGQSFAVSGNVVLATRANDLPTI